MKRLLVIFLLLTVATAQEPPQLKVETSLDSFYLQGQSDEIELRIVLDDPAETLQEGVLFLNVVELDAARGWPQAAHKIFSSASETPSVFRTPYTGAALRAGFTTRLSFQLRERAKLGDYALVVQLYRGRETHPNRVKAQDRVAMRGFDFHIVAE